jgi:hypothetical protein
MKGSLETYNECIELKNCSASFDSLIIDTFYEINKLIKITVTFKYITSTLFNS